MKAVIYYRKSTDRDDRQANSLEHQLANCRKIAALNSLDIVKEIWENASAKTEWTRPGFNELIKLCKSGKIDYVVIDEAKRLSRNNLDSARVIDLFDKGYIKGIYSTGRTYLAEQINDVFLLQLDLSLSKMDNAHRSKDVKEKMITCMNNTGRFLGKAPFGYRNVTIKKGHKEIVVDKKEAAIVKEIFSLRLENKAFSTIAEMLKKKYGWSVAFRFETNRIHRLVGKKFYYWVFEWNGKEHIGNHKPLISKETYDKANALWRGVYETEHTLKDSKREYRTYFFKWLAKDPSGILLASYEKKGHIYYSSQARSSEKVCINERQLFEKAGLLIKELDGGVAVLREPDKQFIMDLLKNEKWNLREELKSVESKINILRKRQEKLLDLKLDETINEKIYLAKHNMMENEIRALKEQKENLKKDNFDEKAQLLFELAGRLYKSYLRANPAGKLYIIKKLMFELLVDSKKSLAIGKTPLYLSSEVLKISFGAPSKIRTHG